MAAYLGSLQRLLTRRPNMLLPAHGPEIPDGERKLREYLAHRLQREAAIVHVLGAGRSMPIDALVAVIYADTPRILWPLAERSLLAHLHKLVHEGRAQQTDAGWRGGAR